MNYSKAGFGSYRIDISIKDHYDALYYALTNGINLIDTSANYADGRSEQLVAKVIEDLISEKKIKSLNRKANLLKMSSNIRKDSSTASVLVFWKIRSAVSFTD